MPEDPAQRAREVLAMCEQAGFASAGVCEAAPSRWGKELRDWLDAGKHGSMEYLAEAVESRLDPRRLLDAAKSVVMVADVYASREDVERPLAHRSGRIARYARGYDYHRLIKKRLHDLCDSLGERFPGAKFRAFVDTAFVLERELAQDAGLGWVGKNTLIIDPVLGSYLLLGGFVTTLELARPSEQRRVPDHCGTCTRCIDSCPTHAITPYSVDATKCISYLTIERESEIDAAFHTGIGVRLYGCDICQEVCPHNSPRSGQFAHEKGVAPVHPGYSARRDSFDVLDVMGWDEGDRRGAFHTSAMKRVSLEMMKRNAVIVAGNILRVRADPVLESRLRHLLADHRESEMVRQTARVVLDRLDSRGPRTPSPPERPQGPAPARTPADR